MESKPVAPAATLAPTPAQALAPPPATAPQSPAINSAEAMQAIVNDPAVKKAMEVFNARIIHVEPRRK